MIFSIECSSNTLSFALSKKVRVVSIRSLTINGEMSEIIVPEIRNFFEDHNLSFKDISCLAVGCGPGSFTGIRTIISVAKGIALSNDHLKILAINSLAGLAMSGILETKKRKIDHIIASIDTKREEAFVQSFNVNSISKKFFPLTVLNEIKSIKIQNLNDYIYENKLIESNILFIGHQSEVIKEKSSDIIVSKNPNQRPHAQWICKIASLIIQKKINVEGWMIASRKLIPLYKKLPRINI